MHIYSHTKCMWTQTHKNTSLYSIFAPALAITTHEYSRSHSQQRLAQIFTHHCCTNPLYIIRYYTWRSRIRARPLLGPHNIKGQHNTRQAPPPKQTKENGAKKRGKLCISIMWKNVHVRTHRSNRVSCSSCKFTPRNILDPIYCPIECLRFAYFVSIFRSIYGQAQEEDLAKIAPTTSSPRTIRHTHRHALIRFHPHQYIHLKACSVCRDAFENACGGWLVQHDGFCVRMDLSAFRVGWTHLERGPLRVFHWNARRKLQASECNLKIEFTSGRICAFAAVRKNSAGRSSDVW